MGRLDGGSFDIVVGWKMGQGQDMVAGARLSNCAVKPQSEHQRRCGNAMTLLRVAIKVSW